ncbi:hypothetical protein WEI85_40650 [Actinomycetes bacterium KLBMP 9797]
MAIVWVSAGATCATIAGLTAYLMWRDRRSRLGRRRHPSPGPPA